MHRYSPRTAMAKLGWTQHDIHRAKHESWALFELTDGVGCVGIGVWSLVRTTAPLSARAYLNQEAYNHVCRRADEGSALHGKALKIITAYQLGVRNVPRRQPE